MKNLSQIQNLFRKKAKEVRCKFIFKKENEIIFEYEYHPKITIKPDFITAKLLEKEDRMLLVFDSLVGSLSKSFEMLPFTLMVQYAIEYSKLMNFEKLDLYLNTIRTYKQKPDSCPNTHEEVLPTERFSFIENLGFQYNKKITQEKSRYGPLDFPIDCYFELNSLREFKYPDFIDIIFETSKIFTQKGQSDASITSKPTLSPSSISNKSNTISYYLTWSGFNGKISFSYLDNGNLLVAATNDAKKTDSTVVSFNEFVFNKGEEKIAIETILDEISEKFRMINEFYPPCDHLLRLLNSVEIYLSKEEGYDIMNKFKELGVDTSIVETQAAEFHSQNKNEVLNQENVLSYQLFKNNITLYIAGHYLTVIRMENPFKILFNVAKEFQEVKQFFLLAFDEHFHHISKKHIKGE